MHLSPVPTPAHDSFDMLSLSHASFCDDETDITCLLCYPGLEIIVFHALPGELCLLAPFLR